jgi:hypothetical protein
VRLQEPVSELLAAWGLGLEPELAQGLSQVQRELWVQGLGLLPLEWVLETVAGLQGGHREFPASASAASGAPECALAGPHGDSHTDICPPRG